MEGKIDLVKIDTEGFEEKILLGGKEFFASHRPLLMIEIFGENKPRMKALLKEIGYNKILKLNSNNYLYKAR